MTPTIQDKQIWDYIEDLRKRIAKLETGGKPLVEESEVANSSFTLGGNSYATITTVLGWDDPSVLVNPSGKLYFSWYVDQDNNANYHWPNGNNIDPTTTLIFWFYDLAESQASGFKETVVHWLVWNLDAGSHTYYVYDLFAFISGQSGAGSA